MVYMGDRCVRDYWMTFIVSLFCSILVVFCLCSISSGTCRLLLHNKISLASIRCVGLLEIESVARRLLRLLVEAGSNKNPARLC